MKPEWRRFAPIGLVIAGLSAVTALVLFVLFRNPIGLPFLLSVGFVLIGLALFALLDPDRVRIAITGRGARYGSNAFLRGIAFFGILVVVNILIFKLAAIYPDKTRVDLTEDKQNTLAPETLNTLAALPEPVKAWGFYSSQASGSKQTADDLLRRYEENSKGNFSYEFLDPDSHPQAVKDANIPAGKDGVISLQMGDKRQLVEFASEQSLTSGLVQLLSDQERVIYFLTGEGELSPDDSGDVSYSTAKSLLENKNYVVKTLNLRTEGQIPDDASVIVIAGPTKPVSEDQVTLVSDFLDRGGALIVMEDPLVQTDFGGDFDPLVEYLASNWGIVLEDDVVIQVAANQATPYITGVDMAAHQIVDNALQNNPPLFALVRSIRLTGDETTITPVELVKTTAFYQNCYPSCSWASTDANNVASWLGGQISDPASPTDSDAVGPLTVVSVAESQETGARLAVFGDADFGSNNFINAYGNSDLFVNTVDWSAGQEELISLTPKNTTQRSLSISPQNLAVVNNLLLLVFVIGLPGLVVISGFVNWLMRRRRG